MTTTTLKAGVRINKYLADRHICSRREADTLITAGKVLVNGKKATLGQLIGVSDTVTVGQTTKKYIYLAYYKGRGIITHSPSQGEVDIASRLKADFGLTNVYPIGRLDKDSEGLLLLTNDGRITGPLLDPELGHEKEYEVTLDKPITPVFSKLMSLGVLIEGYKTKPATVRLHPRNDQQCTITLTEGKKHQIRRMCAALGYQVKRLKRIRIMHINLGSLKPNQFRKLTKPETDTLLTSLGVTI